MSAVMAPNTRFGERPRITEHPLQIFDRPGVVQGVDQRAEPVV
jgi:hypothetical protein